MKEGRVKKDSLVWILLCCGCLPIVGLIQGILICVPVTLMLMIPTTIFSLIFLPPTVVMSFYTYIVNTRLGPKIKILGILLIPIPLFLYPAVCIVCSFLVGFFYGLFYPMILAFDESYELFCGTISKVFKDIFKLDEEIYKIFSKTVFDELRTYREPFTGEVWDISLGEMAIGFFMSIIGCIIDGITITIISVVLFLPCFFRFFYEYLKAYLCGKGTGLEAIMYFLPWLIGIGLVPVAAVLTLAALIIGSFLWGLYAGAVSYKDGIKKSFEFIWEAIKNVAKYGTEFIVKGMK